MISGAAGGGFQPLGNALAREYEAAGFEVALRPSDGSVSNVRAILSGTADIGFSYADVAYSAYVGRLPGAEDGPRLRSLAVLELNPVHLLVRAKSGIRSIADLRRRRVAIGGPGSGSAATAVTVMTAFGLPDGAFDAVWLSYSEASSGLIKGTLDAMFVTGSVPLGSVEATVAAGMELLPLTKPPIEHLEAEYPFFRPTLIPAGAYATQQAPVPTIGVDNLLVARADLDERLAHDLTAALLDALPTLVARDGLLRLMSIAQAPAAPVPLHEGAARVYRERELAR